MLPKFSSLFSKKEPAGKAEESPSVPAVTPPPAQSAPRPAAPSTAPIPRPGQMGVTRVLPTPVPVGLRAPLRAPLPSPAPLDPARNKKRITQRITVNVPPSTVSDSDEVPGKLVIPGAKSFSEFQPQSTTVAGSVQVPLSLVLKSLPPQILAPEAQNFLEHPDSGATVPVPLGAVLSMLPSGKLEFSIKEFLPLLPGSALRPMDESSSELQMVFALPLPEVFKLIPPEHIGKRRDQKPIDPRIMSMADPFSEDELKKKAAEAAEASGASVPLPVSPSLSPDPIQVEPSPTPVSPIVSEVAKIEKEEAPLSSSEESVSEEAAIITDTPAASEGTTSEISPEVSIPEAPENSAPVDLLALLAKANKEVDVDDPVASAPPVAEISSVLPDETPTNVNEQAVVSEISEEKPSDFTAALRQLDVEEKSSEVVSLKEEDLAQTSEAESSTQEAQTPILEEAAPVVTNEVEAVTVTAKEPTVEPIEAPSPRTSVAVDVNQCSVEDLVGIGCPEGVARKILAWRELHGPFGDIRRIRRIPGMTDEIYRNVIGLPDPNSPINRELNEAFGLSSNESLTVKDVATRIRRWPYMVACIIGGMEGLPIAFDGEDAKYADLISAFVPRLFQQTNTILEEVEESQTQEIHLVKDGRSLSIYCCGHLFLVTVNLRKDVSGRESDLIREIVTRLAELKESKLKA